MLSENPSDPFEFVDEDTTGMARINVLHICCFYLKAEISKTEAFASLRIFDNFYETFCGEILNKSELSEKINNILKLLTSFQEDA